MDVRIKYPFKHFQKEGIAPKPMKRKIERTNDHLTDVDDDTTMISDGDALIISSNNHSHVNYTKQQRIVKRNPIIKRDPNENKRIVEKHCYGIQPGISQTEITTELIRYAQLINRIKQTNPQLFLRKHQ
ncbi:hypothetical protein KSF78_0007636 [Schistosoma japonicum]|uniref:Uncharacterized protein n=1 Tax=Schistosoma japonicum TaxID=6182 RepID=C1LFY6_SCHJA|nr:hypothetical protein KSF78_0007636 [Schistosoma japonicum]CAX73614.1 hypothetical protein [Schistosoma japonicum]